MQHNRSDIRRTGSAFGVLTAATWLLVGFGGAVRANGAGLACPDWPLCFGKVVPPLDVQVGFEWGHRVYAGGISLALLAGLIWIARSPEARRAVGWLPVVTVGVLVAQIVFGGLTVMHLLAPWTVSGHLLLGNAFLASLALLSARLLADPDRPQPTASLAEHGVAASAVVLLLLQLRVGSMLSSNLWGLACTDFPACLPGDFFPTDGPAFVHSSHRLVAYTLAALWIAAAFLTRAGTTARLAAFAGVGVVLVQILLGVANVLWLLPVPVTVLHTATAALLTLCTAVLAWDVSRRAAVEPVVASASKGSAISPASEP